MKKFAFLSFILALPLFGEMPPAFEKVEDTSPLAILSPSLAQRKTAKIRLSNGLEAYLVSDPGIEKSAAALAVEAGSWQDPIEYPGMAHFLEHMLFMGTAAYPKEFEYMQFINDYGGNVNAYTASDRTVYMFSVNNEGFEGALDRFSHFFIDPLFLQSSIERELLAVDQEHSKNIEHDGWRQYMIFKETGNPHHPNAKFSTGNADTLKDIPQQAMKKWYKDHYSANKMHLVILSPLPLEQIVDFTTKSFSQVPSQPIKNEVFPANMTSDQQRGHTIYIKPVKDLKILSLNWELPPKLAQDKDFQAGKLIAYVLKNGSKNSLLSTLKKEHLASAISATEERSSKNNAFFTIDIELTDLGLQQTDKIVTFCFETLARLKKTSIPRYIFNEVKTIAEMKYQYQSREDAFDFVLETAHKLVDEPLESFPRKTLCPTKYDPQVINQYLDYLTPSSCIFCLTADPAKTQIYPTKQETWMGAEYTVKPLLQRQITAWTKAHLNPQITLPPPNLFIPKSLELIQQSGMTHPALLENTLEGKIFYAADEDYLVPEITYFFQFRSPLLEGSAKAYVLSDLYLKALHDQLFPILSAATVAGSTVGFYQNALILGLEIHGFSDQSNRLAEEIFKGMTKIAPTKEQFELYKQSIIAAYENGEKELPLFQSFELLNSIVFNNASTNFDKLKALEKVTYEDLIDFSNQLFKKTYVEGLFYGNIAKPEAESLWASLKDKLKSDPYPLVEQTKRQVLILPEKQGPYMVLKPSNMQGNAAVLMIEQGPYTFAKRASQQILGRVLKDAFFDTLRTKQQTAYIAKAWEKEEEKQLLQYFAVQSSSHKPSELIARFELFLENFIKQFTTKFPEERFEKVRTMAIASLQMPPENLQRNGARLFSLAVDYNSDFQLIEKRIAALQNLSYDQLRKDAISFLSRANTRRIAVLAEGITAKEKTFHYEPVSKELLQKQGMYVSKAQEVFQEPVEDFR